MMVLAFTLAAAMTLAACGGDDDGGGGGGGGGDGGGGSLDLGLSIPFLSTPFFVVMTDQVEAETEAAGIEMLEPTNADQDSGQQITDVRTLVDQGATGILAGLVDAGAIGPALDYAESQDVPVVVVDDKPSQGKVFMTVPADNAGMGAQACEVMGKDLKGKGTVLSLQGELAATNGRDRTDGFNECMADKYPDIKIIERPTKWQTPLAANQAQTVVTSTPDLNGIYMQDDSVMLSAVLQVLKRAGKDAKVGEPGRLDFGEHRRHAARRSTRFAASSMRRSRSRLTCTRSTASSTSRPRPRARPSSPGHPRTTARSSRTRTAT